MTTTWPHCHFCDKPYIPITGINGCPWCDTQAQLSALNMTFDLKPGTPAAHTKGHDPTGRPYCETGCSHVTEKPSRGWRSLCSTCRKQRHAHNQKKAA